MSLTAEEEQTFHDQGFLLKKNLFPAAWMAQIREECADIHRRMAADAPADVHIAWVDPDNPIMIHQLMNSDLVSPTMNRILRSEALLDIVADLIGPNVSLYHSKLLPKSAGSALAIPWHQDYAYWKRDDNRPLMINAMLAIDPATRENGCLEFIPGSHAWGLQEHERHKEAFGLFLPGHYHERPESARVDMEPGDVNFFTSLVIHGSAPNLSNADRWANTFAYNVTGNNVQQCREVLRGMQL